MPKVLTAIPTTTNYDWAELARIADESNGYVFLQGVTLTEEEFNSGRASLHRKGYGLRKAYNIEGKLLGVRVSSVRKQKQK